LHKGTEFKLCSAAKLIVVIRIYKWLTPVFIWLSSVSFSHAQDTSQDTILPHEKLYSDAGKLVDSLKYEAALPLLKKAVKIKPTYWEAFNRIAFINIKLKNYKEATKALEKADQIAPFNYETLKLKGINSFLSNDFKGAKAAFDTAVYVSTEEKIDDAELFYYRAQLMFKGKSYKTALEALETAVDFKPNYLEAIQLKGEIRFSMKDYNYAVRELNEAIRLMGDGPKDMKAYKLRAKSKFELGDYKGAIADWNVYIENIPKEEDALVSRAAAKININDNSGAIADLDEAIKLDSKNPVSYCYRGVAKGGNKQYLEALKDLDYSIKLKFDYPAAYVNRAAIKMASKDKRGACADLEKADGLGDEMAIKLFEKYCR
jgi:tetratricopeptide (TPR) repeat protein